MYNSLLHFYFHRFLEAGALLPPFLLFPVISLTGHFFRRWDTYRAWFEPGVLLKALKNLEESGIVFPHGAKRAVRDYLCFESRLVAENIWIRKNDRKLAQSFLPSDIALLRDCLQAGPHVIVTAHTSALYPLVALLDTLGFTSPFLCNNALRQPFDKATPLQKNVMKTMSAWRHRQPLFFVEEGKGITKSLAALLSGHSVVVPQDVPGYGGDRGVKVRLFQKEIWSPAGPARLAREAGVPMLLVVGWASRCTEPYRIYLKKLIPTGDSAFDMQCVCEGIEEAVRRGPSCWGGWLYLDKMMVALTKG